MFTFCAWYLCRIFYKKDPWITLDMNNSSQANRECTAVQAGYRMGLSTGKSERTGETGPVVNIYSICTKGGSEIVGTLHNCPLPNRRSLNVPLHQRYVK